MRKLDHIIIVEEDEIREAAAPLIAKEQAKLTKIRDKNQNTISVIEEYLGHPGVMLSGNKSSPPGHECYWNSCLFNEKGDQLWWGDIDLTKKEDTIQALAKEIGKFYITRENPFRWDGLKNGLLYADRMPGDFYRVYE
jgi:hypothetical protein